MFVKFDDVQVFRCLFNLFKGNHFSSVVKFGAEGGIILFEPLLESNKLFDGSQFSWIVSDNPWQHGKNIAFIIIVPPMQAPKKPWMI